jgi:hypothetical protein
MLKKVIIAVFVSGLITVLIWGGINRTLAKTNDHNGKVTANQYVGSDEFSEGNGVQRRNKVELESNSGEECDKSNHQSYANGQINEDIKFVTDQFTGNSVNVYGQEKGNLDEHGGSGYRNGQGGGLNPLTASEVEALYLVLNDEYYALAVYQSVIATFGEVDPFIEIAISEQRHIDALIKQFNKYDLDIPDNPWTGNVAAYDSIEQACQAGVEAEIANAELYNQLFRVTNNFNLSRVFTHLSNASLNNQLPQLEACQ